MITQSRGPGSPKEREEGGSVPVRVVTNVFIFLIIYFYINIYIFLWIRMGKGHKKSIAVPECEERPGLVLP